MIKESIQPVRDAESSEGRATNHRTYELLHYPNSDILLNNDSEWSAWAHQLAELFKENPPVDWEETGAWESVGEFPGMAHSSVDGVNFMMKRKRYSGSKYQHHKERVERKFPGSQYLLRRTQLMNSVLNEFALSPIIKRLVADEEAQNVVARHGFRQMQLVEPVMGVVYRKNGVKRVVYKYIDNATPLETASDKRNRFLTDEPQSKKSLCDDLEQFFYRHGIDPFDLGLRQLMTDPEGVLYLTDIEDYRLMSPEERQNQAPSY